MESNDGQATQQQSNNISQDIFVKPTMTAETRSDNNSSSVQMRLVTESLNSRMITFTKEDGE